MVAVNYQNLPAPLGFSIDLEALDLWDYWPESADRDGPSPRLNLAFTTPTVDVWLVEMPPDTALPWHTHEPHTSQVYWLLQGRIRTNYRDNDGERHSYEADAEDEELVYLPAGAHNQIESVGEDPLRFLAVKEGGGTINGRLEHLFDDPSKHYDPDSDPLSPGLDIVPTRGHVFDSQDDALEEY